MSGGRPHRVGVWLALLFIQSGCGLASAWAASFDCSKAATLVESAICRNTRLSLLDERLAVLYREALSRDALTRPEQIVWLKQRDQCRDEACLIAAYERRIDSLSHAANAGGTKAGQAGGERRSYSGNAASGESSDEVGDRIIVSNPKARPVFTSPGGTRYWPCEGLVNANLIPSIYSDLKAISERHGVPVPQPSTCLYSIGKLKLASTSVDVYQVDFYVDRDSMQSCLVSDVCKDFRSMTFRPDGQQRINRTYMVTSYAKRLTAMACHTLDGSVISATQACR